MPGSRPSPSSYQLRKVGNADSAFAFPAACHGFIDPDMFETEIWRPIVDRADFKGTRFHDLRLSNSKHGTSGNSEEPLGSLGKGNGR
jgi:hypothetical protein